MSRREAPTEEPTALGQRKAYIMHSLLIAVALMSANVQPTTITVHEVVITSYVPKGTERFVCETTWHDSSIGGQYRNCNTFVATGTGNWINRDYHR